MGWANCFRKYPDGDDGVRNFAKWFMIISFFTLLFLLLYITYFY
jgi:hypothetical protein